MSARPTRRLGVALGAALGAALLVHALPVSAAPRSVPIVLSAGWEAADGDPAGGIHALDTLIFTPSDPMTDPAPREAVRWYRVRVDLSGVSGGLLGFYAPAIRDVDEAYFAGVKIGGQGSFPPHLDKANILPRHYVIPPRLLAEPGPKELVLRVWHGRRDGTTFRAPPRIDSFAALESRRASLDESLAFMGGVAVTIAVVFYLFAFQARGAREYPLFATFALLLGLYALTLHSGWGRGPLSRELPFRLSAFASGFMGVCYLPAIARMSRAAFTRRMLFYQVWFGGFALFASTVPNTENAVLFARVHPWIVALAFADLSVSLARSASPSRPRSIVVVAAHSVFTVGVLVLAEIIPTRGVAGPAAAVPFLGAGFLMLSITLLWAMSDQVSRFRLGALTDPGTRLWNRRALFDEIEGRLETRAARPALGLIVIDLDRFKEWNDLKGHLAGDRLLLRVARALQDASRPGDLVARYGGDEFAVVLERVDGVNANAVAARFHGAVTEAVLAESPDAPVTASVGVAVYEPSRHATASELFHDADRALYDAKGAGKNRVVVFASRGDGRRSRSGESRPVKAASSGENRRPR